MANASENETAVTKPAQGRVGFALGGLGGFNAYEVGFLQAVRQLRGDTRHHHLHQRDDRVGSQVPRRRGPGAPDPGKCEQDEQCSARSR